MSRKRLQFGAPPKRKTSQRKTNLESVPERFEADIENLTLEGRGVARVSGKTVFVSGALPGERVSAHIQARHKRYDEADTEQVLIESSERQQPPCAHYDQCGGCQLQHLRPEAQLSYKEQLILDQLSRFADTVPEQVASPLTSDDLGYRRSARIGINQRSSGELIIGFRRQNSNKLLDIDRCPVLDPRINQLLESLRDLLAEQEGIKHLTHLDISCGDTASALTIRVTRAPDETLLESIGNTCAAQGFALYIEDNSGNVVQISADPKQLSYGVLNGKLNLQFAPGDFLQVNAAINHQMIEQALEWLAPRATDRVLDLFCGLGNFTLPLATRAGRVVGVEGSAEMVSRAKNNAKANGLDNAEFFKSDLSADIRESVWYQQTRQSGFDLILLDPPRSGAEACVQRLADYGARAVLYISCNPAALVRDTQHMKKAGYRMTRFAVMDMFPHTAHVESMALFQC
ncbi:23S rRNA (uracil(1939)-C(5))-methyltransferase RlmD [Marinobacterium sp. YM272]|uniref:23S rRNA (uracil(1939)-C(5))-methyltransferase RlmD n=1 Tax=Marinobacterium sp. YM272 TaxID=3421654 RepID=UPI003D7F7BD5